MGTDSEDFLSFSRNELLHLLLDGHVVNDEEDTLLSSILQNRFDIPSPKRTILGEEPTNSLLCGFAFAFDRHAKYFAFSFNAYYSS